MLVLSKNAMTAISPETELPTLANVVTWLTLLRSGANTQTALESTHTSFQSNNRLNCKHSTAQLPTVNQNFSGTDRDRHPSLRTKLQFVDADLKVFLLLRAAQSESDLKYSRTMPTPNYLCTLIDTEVGTLQRKADNATKFKIVHTWRLYYNTCNVKLGGDKLLACTLLSLTDMLLLRHHPHC